MEKHLLVVSIDAMVYEDLEYAKTLPNFKKVFERASVIEKVRTIYPTLTHPIHATILSGATAGKTGIVNNSMFNRTAPDKDSGVWFNELSQIKCDTLIHAAHRAGLTVAVSTWPVTTGDCGVIDYLVPGALNSCFEGREDDPLSVYRSLGAGENVMDIIEEGVRRYGWRDQHPEVDFFQAYCLAQIIKRYKPNLMLTHLGNVDSDRHKFGVFGDKINEAVRLNDGWLGELLSALSEAGIEDSTDIVLLSDHGQIGVTRGVSPNVALVENGYIDLSESGDVSDYRAYAKSAGGSCQIYLKNPQDTETKNGVFKLLSGMAKEGVWGFERVFEADELKEKYGFYGDFSFVLETDGYSFFSEWLLPPYSRTVQLGNYKYGKGKHGHEPSKGPQPIFIGAGPSFAQGVILESGSILNHGPTLAKILGVELLDSDGQVEEKLLK